MVVSLQQVLSDKSARGAFGEVQLEALVRTLPPGVYEFQAAVGGGREKGRLRADHARWYVAHGHRLKFPLSDYRMAIDAALPEAERATARISSSPPTSKTHQRHRQQIHPAGAG